MSPEGLECPGIAFLIVAYHVRVPVVGSDAEVDRTRAVPLVVHALNAIDALAQHKP